MKKTLRRIWKLIPNGRVKIRLHCWLYSGKIFKYSFQDNTYAVRGPGGIAFKTVDIPFNLTKYYLRFLKYYHPAEGNVLLDVGAFNGHVSILLSKFAGPAGRVFAFEPDPINFEIVHRNLALNDIKNVTVLKKGLWIDDEPQEFNSNGSVASSVFFKAEDARVVHVEMMSLDHFAEINALEKCDFIKMNIEGSEVMALRGGSGMLRKWKPRIVVTTDHIVDGKITTDDVERILQAASYRVWTERDGGARITYAE
jgi:FkbM family methyltransferase